LISIDNEEQRNDECYDSRGDGEIECRREIVIYCASLETEYEAGHETEDDVRDEETDSRKGEDSLRPSERELKPRSSKSFREMEQELTQWVSIKRKRIVRFERHARAKVTAPAAMIRGGSDLTATIKPATFFLT
jgi:hypothetical protein